MNKFLLKDLYWKMWIGNLQTMRRSDIGEEMFLDQLDLIGQMPGLLFPEKELSTSRSKQW